MTQQKTHHVHRYIIWIIWPIVHCTPCRRQQTHPSPFYNTHSVHPFIHFFPRGGSPSIKATRSRRNYKKKNRYTMLSSWSLSSMASMPLGPVDPSLFRSGDTASTTPLPPAAPPLRNTCTDQPTNEKCRARANPHTKHSEWSVRQQEMRGAISVRVDEGEHGGRTRTRLVITASLLSKVEGTLNTTSSWGLLLWGSNYEIVNSFMLQACSRSSPNKH